MWCSGAQFYKTLQQNQTKCLFIYKWGEVRTPKCILISKTWSMPASVEFPFRNLKSTWKCGHRESAPYPTLSTPSFNHRWSMQSAFWMATHGNEPADWWFFTVNRGHDWEEDEENQCFWHRKQDVWASGGYYKSHVNEYLIHIVLS